MRWIYVITWMVIQANGPVKQAERTRTFSTRDSAYTFIRIGQKASSNLIFKIDSVKTAQPVVVKPVPIKPTPVTKKKTVAPKKKKK